VEVRPQPGDGTRLCSHGVAGDLWRLGRNLAKALDSARLGYMVICGILVAPRRWHSTVLAWGNWLFVEAGSQLDDGTRLCSNGVADDLWRLGRNLAMAFDSANMGYLVICVG